MATCLCTSLSPFLIRKQRFITTPFFCVITRNCHGNTSVSVTRRSANYKPNNWDYSGLARSPKFDHLGTNIVEAEIERLRGEIRDVLSNGEMQVLQKLEFIDTVQRLGLQHHFDVEIKKALRLIRGSCRSGSDDWVSEDDLYATALMFRLLRQHGYLVRQDVFKKFMDDDGTFDELAAVEVKALLSLYEASFYGLEGENILDEAKEFAAKHLKVAHERGGIRPDIMDVKVQHALDMPVLWRPNRLEARWFMDVYQQEEGMSTSLLDLARLDFNAVQSIHRKEVSNMARWWVELGLNKMDFSRDRLMEHYLWCSTIVFEPQHGTCRELITMMASMITLIDDVYDAYGTLEELRLFTDIVDRWDTCGIDQLPHAMKVSLLALYDTTNQICDRALKEKGIHVLPYLRKAWADQCRAYLEEATWYHESHKPTMEQYLESSVTTVGAKMMLLCICFLTNDDPSQQGLDYLSQVASAVYCTALICRLNNDLGTSSYELARGDNNKAVECYMNEAGVSGEVATKHVQNLVYEAWKTMNKEMMAGESKSPGLRHFLGVCLNYARASQCFDKYGDGHDVQDGEIDNHIMSALVEPVPICNE